MLKQIILFSLLSGITVFIGGLISYFFERRVKNKIFKDKFIHFLVAFSTGIMIAAIAFVLIPQGMENLSVYTSVILFLLGAITFYFLDEFIQKNNTKVPQIMAMLLDFIPESIALGAMFVYDYKVGVLLAVFIALQNLPESFNSYIELRASRFSSFKALIVLFLLSFIGLIFSMLGYFVLNDKIEITASLMVFASGGIMYLIFQDIAPTLKLKSTKLVTLGVNFGFVIGMLGEGLL